MIHRIIGGDGASGWTMQGDNNSFIDPFAPTASDVLGIAVMHLPRAGLVVRAVSAPWVWGSILAIAAALVLWPSRRDEDGPDDGSGPDTPDGPSDAGAVSDGTGGQHPSPDPEPDPAAEAARGSSAPAAATGVRRIMARLRRPAAHRCEPARHTEPLG